MRFLQMDRHMFDEKSGICKNPALYSLLGDSRLILRGEQDVCQGIGSERNGD